MVNYKDLGLVNTREMFRAAVKGGYAIPAYNFNNMEQLQAIVIACAETRSPVIIQVSKGARNTRTRRCCANWSRTVKSPKISRAPAMPSTSITRQFERCVSCIENVFSSVMIDGSPCRTKNVSLRAGGGIRPPYDLPLMASSACCGIEDEVS